MSTPELTSAQWAALDVIRANGSSYLSNRTRSACNLVQQVAARALVRRGFAELYAGPDGEAVRLIEPAPSRATERRCVTCGGPWREDGPPCCKDPVDDMLPVTRYPQNGELFVDGQRRLLVSVHNHDGEVIAATHELVPGDQPACHLTVYNEHGMLRSACGLPAVAENRSRDLDDVTCAGCRRAAGGCHLHVKAGFASARIACGLPWMAATSSSNLADVDCANCLRAAEDTVDTGVPERPAHFEQFEEAGV